MVLKKFKLPILLSCLTAANAWYYATGTRIHGDCSEPLGK